jgi:hypothetical protein
VTLLRPQIYSQRLPELLPGIYGGEDAGLDGRPLRVLLGILGGELDALHEAIGRLWDDHFVERASAEALPLLGELLGARLYTADVRVQRAVISRSVAWRRRKGTLVTLEDILSLTSLWDVEVEEAFRSLLVTQDLNALVPWRGRTSVLWDPIALSDPLSRRVLSVDRPRIGTPRLPSLVQPLAVAVHESLDQALRRLGRADAGRVAVSPRNLDLLGWARPAVALVRAARLVAIELEEIIPSTLHALPGGWVGLRVDPLDRDGPLVWLKPRVRAELAGGTTARHEPDPSPAEERTAAQLLTPTALAEDTPACERARVLTLSVEGIPVVGATPLAEARGPLAAAPIGPRPVLRFADEQRPSPDDAWTLELFAAREDRDIPLLTVSATSGATSSLAPTPEARQVLQGATIGLSLRRDAGLGRIREADGTWTAFDAGGVGGEPRSNVVALSIAAATWLVRVEQRRATGSARLARLRLPAPPVSAPPPPEAQWEFVELGGSPPADAPGMTAVADGAELLLVADDRAGRLGVWRVSDVAGTPLATRIDTGGPRLPPARLAPAACVHDARLFVHGGELGGAPTGDLWSIPLAGGSWRPHAVRHRQERIGGTLLSVLGGLVLLGGQAVAGALSLSVSRCDPSSALPAWRALPALPFDGELPGAAVAHAAPAGIEALVWADRTRPRRLLLGAGASAWSVGALESGGTNPPADGEALYVDDRVIIAGPPPLPPSDVLFTLGGRGQIAFLPALDVFVGEAMRFHVASDGATFADPRPGQPLPLHTRPGGLLHRSLSSELGGPRRLSVPERLARRPFVLRQHSLGPWEQLLPPSADDAGVVLLDPRLGRVVLDASVPRGRVTLSARVGRGAAIGAGAMPVDRAPPALWREPDIETPVPPDLRAGAGSAAPLHPVSAWIAPDLAGGFVAAGGSERPVVATAEEGIALASPPVLGVLGSPRLAPMRLVNGIEAGLSLFAADFGSVPIIDADARGNSLTVHPRFGGQEDTRLWFAGLWFTGELALVLARGQIDFRWCNLGVPGRMGLSLAGAGHQDVLALRSIPRAEVELRLYGCQVGEISIPPWVRLIAAGCVFAAGDRGEEAIRAAGARVRLRHCTVLGTTRAGQLEASSCAFAGRVDTDRPDLGWLRYCLLPRGGTPPTRHRSLVHDVSFASVNPTDPTYLVLADNNGPAALTAAEQGGVPGAHAERTDHERELSGRTLDNLPIGMQSVHVDRIAADLAQMSRR